MGSNIWLDIAYLTENTNKEGIGSNGTRLALVRTRTAITRVPGGGAGTCKTNTAVITFPALHFGLCIGFTDAAPLEMLLWEFPPPIKNDALELLMKGGRQLGHPRTMLEAGQGGYKFSCQYADIGPEIILIVTIGHSPSFDYALQLDGLFREMEQGQLRLQLPNSPPACATLHPGTHGKDNYGGCNTSAAPGVYDGLPLTQNTTNALNTESSSSHPMEATKTNQSIMIDQGPSTLTKPEVEAMNAAELHRHSQSHLATANRRNALASGRIPPNSPGVQQYQPDVKTALIAPIDLAPGVMTHRLW
ncbi:hypothetical protein DFH28DRAFT_1137566 [Melampsora americana]|nr:hypothetical protein DFH28DRAFT_1137566 [Melampsora americana]